MAKAVLLYTSSPHVGLGARLLDIPGFPFPSGLFRGRVVVLWRVAWGLSSPGWRELNKIRNPKELWWYIGQACEIRLIVFQDGF